jgi:threonine 3-dehydrogenase
MSDNDTMRAVIKSDSSHRLEIARVPIPRPGPREALIKIAATSICGTDLHIFKWDPWAHSRINPPIIVGHEFCGHVAEIGEMATEAKVGDYVSAESHIICHTCSSCRTGWGHLCQNTKIIGVDRDGCWADYIVMPAENLWLNPPALSLEVAGLQENFGNAVHTAFAADLTTHKMLVTGCARSEKWARTERQGSDVSRWRTIEH